MRKRLRPDIHILFVLLLPPALLLFGISGYHVIERWPFSDCLYMTVITVATVGFQEVHPLSQAGRMFTVVLIISGVFILAYCIQFFVMYMLQKNILGTLWRRRMDRAIRDLKDHVIVCGYGKIGRHASEQLLSEGVSFVIIDRALHDGGALREKGMLFVEGNAEDEEKLKEAGIMRAKTLVAVVGSDADNLFITMTARGLAPGIRIVARAEDASNRGKLLRAGADKVVLPYEIGGRRIAAQVLYPSVADFLETAMSSESMDLRIAEIAIGADSQLKGLTLLDSKIRKGTGAVILAIKSVGGALAINPEAETKLNAGDMLICLGTQGQLQTLQKLAGG